MNGINNTDKVNSLKRVENNKTKKDKAVKKNQSEQKTGDLSAQMAYLASINRVNINKKPASASNKQENISFKGSGNSDTISAEDIDTLSNEIDEYNSKTETEDTFNIDDLDMSEWSEIESKENKTLFGKSKGTYTYTASNGTKVTVENSDGVQILENNETGEILVIGAKGAEIKGSGKDNTITVYDSEIDSITTGSGVDNIKVYNSTADTIKTGKGTDSIYINDSTVETLNSGAGSDFISVTNSDTTKINTSSSFLNGILDKGEDTVILNDSTAETLKTGRGDDTVAAEESSVTTLKSGRGSDSLSLNETDVDNLKTNKKDTVVEDGNYLDFDTSLISEIESDVNLEYEDGTSISLTEYIQSVINSEAGFETEEEYEEYVIETLTNNLETMKSVYQTQEDNDGIVSDVYNILKELSGLGISSDDIETYIEEQEAIIEGLTAAMNGESSMTFEEAYEYYTGTTYSQEKIDNYIEVSNTYSAVMIGCSYDEDYADKFEEATGISVNDLATEFALCQTETFGQTSELEELVDKYSEDQESFKDNISAVISTTGIVCMVAGAVICVACPVAAGAGMALMSAGKTISLTGMFIDNGLDLIDDTTDSDGLTKEEAADIALETGVEAVSYAAGRGIGKLTNGLNTVVASKVSEAGAGKIASYVAGQTAETVADTTLSLGADYAIAQGQSYITTGEFMDAEDYWSLERFTGEGRNQLMGILTGLASSKVSAYQQTAIATAQTKVLSGDTEGAKAALEASGIKTTDASFDDFVEQVKAVDAGTVKASSDTETVDVESETVKTDSETDSPATLLSSKTQSDTEETDIQTKNAAVESESTKIKSNDSSSTKSSLLSLDDIAKMSQDEKMEYLKNKGVSEYDDEEDIASLEDDKYQNALELLDKGVSEYFVKDIASLEDNKYQKALEVLDKGVHSFYVKDIASLEGDKYENALKLLDKGVRSSDVKDIVSFEDNKYKKALKLLDKGVRSSDVKDIVSLEDNKYKKALEVLDKGVRSSDVKDIASLEDNKYKKALEVLDKGVRDIYDVKDIVSLEDNKYKKALEVLDKGVHNIYDVKNIASLEDNKYKKALELLDKGAKGAYVKDIASLEGNKYQNALEFLDKGEDIASLDNDQYQRAVKLLEKGVRSSFVKDIASHEYDKYQNVLVFLDKGEDIASLDNDQYQRAVKLLEKGVYSYYVKDIASLEGDKYKKALELLDKGAEGAYVKDIASLEGDKYKRALELLDKGAEEKYVKDIASLDNTQYQSVKSFIQKFNNTTNTQMKYEETELQNGAGTQVKTSVSWDSKFVDEETGDEYNSKIKVKQTIEPDGTIKIERTETYEDGTSKSWYIDGDSTFDTVSTEIPVNSVKILTSQTEIIYNKETGEPESVLVTKKSDDLEGVYEKTQYTLEDYPEDYDVLKGINDGTIEGGTQLSKVTVNDDGSKTYTENVSSNGSNIQRTYTQSANGTDYDYHYTITDETGTQILDTSVSFTKNSDNQTTTVINGTEYVANFDDTTHIIEITGSDGTTKTIDISKLADSNLEECWQAAKNLTSDSLETLSQIGKWIYTDDNLKSFLAYFDEDNSKIAIKDNAQTIAHEVGHAKDFISLDLREDAGLIEIYNSEMKTFNSRYTDDSGQAYIQYFSQNGGSGGMFGDLGSTGLNELIAETNMLLTNYGHDIAETESRAQFLVQNFPKTMAYIADKFGLNAAGQE